MPINALTRYLYGKHAEQSKKESWTYYIADLLRMNTGLQTAEPKRFYDDVPRYYDMANSKKEASAPDVAVDDGKSVSDYVELAKSLLNGD